MSRFTKFAHSLFSGYLLLGVNILYTLASIPLALHYLDSKEEFGLWVLTSQIVGFIALLDLGMGSSLARILIDHKDKRANGRYGSTLKTGLLVGAAQGALALAGGLALVMLLGDWLRVPAHLSRPFLGLMVGQLTLVSLSFVTRTFGQVLFAWQRMDIQNYSQMIQLAVNLAVLWFGFRMGWGVYSLLGSSVAGWVVANGICAGACLKLGLWPKAGEWGRVTRKQFNELFAYATDLFLIVLGSQLIISSQTVLVTRMLGMEAAALWSVMTKAYQLVSLLILRIIGTTMPALGEMQAWKEEARLWERYRGLFLTVNVLGAVCAILFAACNGPFVHVWTNGLMSWPPVNDFLLAVWMVFSIQQCCHNSLIVCRKEVRGTKYIYLIEGVVFVAASVFALPRWGMTGMLLCSLLCTLVFTWTNGVVRVAGLLRAQNQPSLWHWHAPLARVLLVMLPCWLALEWWLRDASPLLKLLTNGCLLGAVGAWVSLRFALPRNLTDELTGKLSASFRRTTGFAEPGNITLPSKLPAGEKKSSDNFPDK